MKKVFLLPVSCRFPGVVLSALGVLFLVLRFYFDYKPNFLHVKVFAISSSYLETKYFQVVMNNISEEILGLLILIGLFFIAFSKDKMESQKKQEMRTIALYLAVYAQFAFLVIAMLFTFGLSFVYMLMINIGFVLMSFIVIYRILLLKK